MFEGEQVELVQGLILATALVSLATAVITSFRAARRVERIHTIVNSKHDALMGWANTLANRLVEAGIDVPPAAGDLHADRDHRCSGGSRVRG